MFFIAEMERCKEDKNKEKEGKKKEEKKKDIYVDLSDWCHI